MVNFGNTTIADLRLGSVQVKAAYLGNKQVWSLGPVVPKYDIKSIGPSKRSQGTSVLITAGGSGTSTLYMRTNATDLTGKIVCASVYANAADATPFTSFSFSNVALSGRYIVGTTPATSQWTPTGWTKVHVKTWIQDAGTIDESAALGEVLSWEAVEASSLGEPLCFTAVDAGATIALHRGNTDSSIVTSTDKQTWTDYAFGTVITLANVGDKVYFRAKTENDVSFNGYLFTTTAGKKIAASGNIQTLMIADGSRLDISQKPSCYQNMFNGCTSLTTAPELPATTLADDCYRYMFQNCTSLTTAPALPATTLANNCYRYMFQNCTSLTTAPALPATTLAGDCYNGMFQGCTALSAIPELNAPRLAIGSYSYMFADCTSLTDVELTAAHWIEQYGYSYMLSGCTDLSSVEVAFTNWGDTATLEWLNNVAATGEFICPAELSDRRGASYIPVGWTKVDAT